MLGIFYLTKNPPSVCRQPAADLHARCSELFLAAGSPRPRHDAPCRARSAMEPGTLVKNSRDGGSPFPVGDDGKIEGPDADQDARRYVVATLRAARSSTTSFPVGMPFYNYELNKGGINDADLGLPPPAGP